MHPFSDKLEETVASLGEKRLLQEVRNWLGDRAPPTPEGMGDDCALIPASAKNQLITTDSVVLGHHFEASASPEQVGEKLLKRNISDIAAMGGNPTRAVIAGFLPRKTRIDWLKSCLSSLAGVAHQYDILIVGGDLTETQSELALNLTLLGDVDHPLLRNGGAPGDWICLTGKIGGSYQSGRHLTFEPRIREGAALALESNVHACIDISDGLAIDLLNLIGDSMTAQLDGKAIPIHEDACEAAQQTGNSPLHHALNDGEDHELLFLMEPVDESKWKSMQENFLSQNMAQLTCIGRVEPRGDHPIVDLNTGQPFPSLSGYDHFA